MGHDSGMRANWRLSHKDADFDARFQALVTATRDEGADVSGSVQAIIRQVRQQGDQALFDLTKRFDRFDLTPENLCISTEDRDAMARQVPEDQRAALHLAAERIRAFHEKQIPQDLSYEDELGVRLGYRWSAVDRAGLYVPGGRAAYPSSLLMAAIPARVAGVQRLSMTVPTPDGHISPLVMAAAQIAGIDHMYRIGGAQAIAALAYGTQSLAPVDVIAGPGNAYVAEAKRQVFGQVGIDMMAGPSEILVIADDHQNPNWIAADLLSQCEHDPSAQAILISPSAQLLTAVEAAIAGQLNTLPTATTAGASWAAHGALIQCADLSHAARLSDQLAPEHLELAVEDPEAIFAQIKHAGSVFLGPYTPEPLGDYLAGPNHVLPTSRTARFSSGLGVHTFMKRTTFLGASPEALRALGPATHTLANAEGLPAHGAAISVRSNAGSGSS